MAQSRSWCVNEKEEEPVRQERSAWLRLSRFGYDHDHARAIAAPAPLLRFAFPSPCVGGSSGSSSFTLTCPAQPTQGQRHSHPDAIPARALLDSALHRDRAGPGTAPRWRVRMQKRSDEAVLRASERIAPLAAHLEDQRAEGGVLVGPRGGRGGGGAGAEQRGWTRGQRTADGGGWAGIARVDGWSVGASGVGGVEFVVGVKLRGEKVHRLHLEAAGAGAALRACREQLSLRERWREARDRGEESSAQSDEERREEPERGKEQCSAQEQQRGA